MRAKQTTSLGFRSLRRRRLALALVAAIAAPATMAQTLPSGHTVVNGDPTVGVSGNTMTITQTTRGAIIDWGSFSIGTGYGVTFNQPTNGVTLNRVVGFGYGPSASFINGNLTSTGTIFLVNQAGITFGGGAQVNVGGLIASTMNISNASFNAGVTSGRYAFEAVLPGADVNSVFNSADITTGTGGTVGFIGSALTNTGNINALGGSVVFGSGQQVTLDFFGDGLTQVTVTGAGVTDLAPIGCEFGCTAVNGRADNAGTITADGGQILMRVAAVVGNTAPAIINTGTLRARSLVSRAGRIELTAPGGTVSIGGFPDGFRRGVIDASGGSFAGGSVLIAGNAVGVLSDPADTANASRIDASGGAGGGTVDIIAADAAFVAEGASINADATNAGNGGRVRVVAGNEVQVLGNISARGGQAGGDGGLIGLASISGDVLLAGTLDASGSGSGDGGTVAIVANSGTAFTNGAIRVDGGVNGGSVQIRGTNVLATDVSTVSANGTTGIGGDIILAASSQLVAFSTLSARGAVAGGSVLTSTGGTFDVRGISVDAGSAGTAGTWTLSAPNIDVVDGSATGSLRNIVLGDEVQDADINRALDFGTNVTLQAAVAGSSGSVYFNPGVDVAYTAGSAPLTFRVDADSSIAGNNFRIGGTGGPLSMVFNSDASNNGFGGISFTSATLTSNGGDISMFGQSDPVGGRASSYDIGIQLANSTVTSGTGNVLVRGSSTGGDAGSDDAGVVLDGTTVTTTTGAVTIDGIGAGVTGGVALRNGSITTGTGAVSITGAGAGGAGIEVNNFDITTSGGAIALDGASTVGPGISINDSMLASGGGVISLLGTSVNDIGVRLGNGDGFVIDSSGGDITIDGTGGTDGVLMENSLNPIVIASGGGSIAITGSGTNTGVTSLDNVINSGSGSIDVTGTATGAGAVGVELAGTRLVGDSGAVTVTGTAASGDGVRFGVGSTGPGGISTTSGAIAVTGTGLNVGLDLTGADLDTVSGDLVLTGNALGASATAGVLMYSGSLATAGGDIRITGTAAGGSGVLLGLRGGFAATSGGGDISITGTGVDAGTWLVGGILDSGGGDIDVTGSASGTDAAGVALVATQLIGTSGDVTVLGNAVAGTGVNFAGQSGISTTTGAISVTGIGATVGLALTGGELITDSGHFDLRGRGTGATSDGLVIGGGMDIVTAGGGIELSGEGGSGAGVSLVAGSSVDAGNSLVVIRAGNDGSSDAIRIGGTISSSLAVNLRPGGVDASGGLTEHVDDQILIAGGSAGFALSGTELAFIDAPELIIGSNLHAGAIQVLGGISRDGNLTLQNDGGSGGIEIQAALDVGTGVLALSSGGDITQSSAGAITAHSLLARAGGDVLLANANNNVAANTLAGSAGGDFQYQDVDALAIGNVSAFGFDAGSNSLSSIAASGISAGGDVFVRNLAGDMTLNANVSGVNIELVTANTLQNPAGASLIASGDWRVWANTWEGETRGGLAGDGSLPNLYGCAYLGQCGVTVPAADNHFIYVQQPTALVTFDSFSREYGLPNPLLTFSVTGAILGDSAANVASGTGTTTATIGSNVGRYPISGNFTSAAGYRIQFMPGTLAVTPAMLVFTADGFVRYLGTQNPLFSGSVSGFRNGDTIQSVFGSGVIWNSPAGLLSPIGFYPVNGGTTATNYVFSQAPGNATALQIIPLPQLSSTPIDLIRETINTYVYDRNFGGAPMCAVNASLEDQQLASLGDELSNEWSKVRSRPNLTNCFETERKNSCGDF